MPGTVLTAHGEGQGEGLATSEEKPRFLNGLLKAECF